MYRVELESFGASSTSLKKSWIPKHVCMITIVETKHNLWWIDWQLLDCINKSCPRSIEVVTFLCFWGGTDTMDVLQFGRIGPLHNWDCTICFYTLRSTPYIHDIKHYNLRKISLGSNGVRHLHIYGDTKLPSFLLYPIFPWRQLSL